MALSIDNSGKQAPKWFRKFKKIYVNLENLAIVLLLAQGFTAESFMMLVIKMGSSSLLENLETILAEPTEEN